MATIIFINANGVRKEIEAKIGESIMRNAVDNGVEGIEADCGGCLSCATCHAFIGESWADKIPEPSADEQTMVECAIDVRPTSRLTCQVMMTEELDGIEVAIPESQY